MAKAPMPPNPKTYYSIIAKMTMKPYPPGQAIWPTRCTIVSFLLPISDGIVAFVLF